MPEIRTSSRQTRALGERLAVNFVMQGSNADIIKVAMIGIDAGCGKRAARRASFSRCTTSCCSSINPGDEVGLGDEIDAVLTKEDADGG